MKRVPDSVSWPWLTWACTAAALLLVDIALLRYTSWADRRVFSRWSPVHFTGIVLVTLAFGLAYLLLAIWGFLEVEDGFGALLDVIPVNTEDNFLHLVLGLTGLAAGAATPKDEPRPRPSPTSAA